MARRADVTVAAGSRRAGIELLARRASGVRVRDAGGVRCVILEMPGRTGVA